MIKRLVLYLLRIFSYKALFPLMRWYYANLFLYNAKSVWLKEGPGIIWFVLGWPVFLCGKLTGKIKYFYSEAIVSNYSVLIRKHYKDNYAYPKEVLSNTSYKDSLLRQHGSLQKLFDNKFLVKIADFADGDSFLDCGCGTGMNIREVFTYFPNSKVAGFDLSANAIDFAKATNENKNLELFVGSVMDMVIFKKFGDKSIDHVLFANMFATILSGSIEETVNFRKKILSEAVRIARKNVIINEHCIGPRKIYIEQKYRAFFYDDYSSYFENMKGQGENLLFPDTLIFLKNKSY